MHSYPYEIRLAKTLAELARSQIFISLQISFTPNYFGIKNCLVNCFIITSVNRKNIPEVFIALRDEQFLKMLLDFSYHGRMSTLHRNGG